MATATRTLNPLPFQDLDPKRFEDLVRQLTYDFKPWRRLEATGRSGSDDGFDARGYEIDASGQPPSDGEFNDEAAGEETTSDRLWLIQCKREQRLGPERMRKHLAEVHIDASAPLYGIVFAAAADISKATRDVLAHWCRENAVSEWQVWGRGELEDKLFQPKFDHLLFAYFGISLTIRRRSQTIELRRQIAIKRKLKRFLDAKNDGLILIRDIDDRTYPAAPEDGSRPRFRVRQARSVHAFGLIVRVSMRQAWLSADGQHWDVALASWGMNLTSYADHWNQPSEEQTVLDEKISDAWERLPADERAWLYVDGLLPYESIILVDDIGDEDFSGPHIYVTDWDYGYQRAHTFIETIQHPSPRKMNIDRLNETPGRDIKFLPEARDFNRKPGGY